MIIAISGAPGSGKSTVAKLLARELGYKHYSAGDIRRRAAEAHGMTIEAWNKHGETHPKTDTAADEEVKKLGTTEDNFVIDGRLAWHFIGTAYKVFITVSEEEGARRILGDIKDGKRDEQIQYSTLEEVVDANRERVASDNRRYEKHYDLKWDNLEAQDLVLDSTNDKPEDTLSKILGAIDRKRADR